MPLPKRARYRRCSSCQVIHPALEFRRAAVPFNTVMGQLQRRTCPSCGHVAPLLGFPIVERPQSDEGEAS